MSGTTETILVAYREGVWRIRVYREAGELKLELPSGVSHQVPFVTSFDRLELYSEPLGENRSHVILDSIPEASHTYLRVHTVQSGAVDRVELRCDVRTYLSGERYRVGFERHHHSSVWVGGNLVVRDHGTRWLKFASFQFGWRRNGNQFVPNIHQNVELHQFNESFPHGLGGTEMQHSALFQIGPFRWIGGGNRELAISRTGVPQMSFFAAGTSSQSSVDYRLFVLRFEHEFSYSVVSNQVYRFGVGPVQMELPGTTLIQTQQGKLFQTHVVKDSLETEPNHTEYGKWAIHLDGLPTSGVIDAWNRSVAEPYLASLHTVESGRPLSCMGLLARWPNSATDQPAWIVGIDVIDRVFSNRVLNIGDFFDGGSPPSDKQILSLRSVLPTPSLLQDDLYLDLGVRNLVRHNSLATAAESYLRIRANVEPIHQQVRDIYYANSGFAFKLRQRFSDNTTNPEQRCRVGALDLALYPEMVAGDTPATPDQIEHEVSELTVSFRRTPSGRAAFLPVPNVTARWRVDRLEPGGQDDPPTERSIVGHRDDQDLADSFDVEVERMFNRENPVVILTNRTSTDGSPKYTLEIRETTDRFQSQELSMRLRIREEGRGRQDAQRIVVFDRHPLTIAQVQIPHFSGIGGADGTSEVGNWSEQGFEGASWELSGNSEGFPLRIPPQAFGEAAEQFKNGEDPEDINEGEAADFRLSAPSQFDLLSSFFRQNFTEAPWNLRRILGYPGQRAAGAQVKSLEFELLYGLSCEITYPNLRLAEITARMGEVGRALPRRFFTLFDEDRLDPDTNWDGKAYSHYKHAYAHQYVAYLSRLGVLEPYDTNQQGTLTIGDDVQYFLREQPHANQKPPFPSTVDGLPGGALWGVNSPGLYRRLLNLKRSSSGLVSRPFFSALGGWGYQKASFDNDTTTIYSDTSMGRVFFYSVETIGHIGVWWNTAKHVVVYERRVVPHKDALFDYTDKQDALLGRPVVREVARYVEIMQPTRGFPDFNASARAPGLVSGIEFKSTIIPVQSSWQKDVLDSNGRYLGYAVRLSDGTSPKPQVVVRSVAPVGSGASTVGTNVSNPENLVFFAYKGPGTGPDTDAWPAIGWVDYPHVAAGDDNFATTNPIRLSNAANATPVPPESPDVPAYVPSDLDASLPPNDVKESPSDGTTSPDYNEKPVGSGAAFAVYNRFTLRINPAGQVVDLMNGRSNTPLTALVTSLTAVRADIARRRDAIAPGKIFQLLRAYGRAPIASGMEFNRANVAYYFDSLSDVVETSAMTALVNRAKDDILKPLGTRLPTKQILDRVVPYEEALKDLDLSQMLPDFAGLKLSKLLPGLKIPNPLDSKRVKITHQFDSQTQSGWIQADINIPISKPTTLFSVDPVEVLLRNATFVATARIESSGSGSPSHRVNGRIQGDWELHVGSLHVLTFVETPLTFDDKGRTRFEISPHKVRLHGILTLLSDLLAQLSDPDSGFTLRLLEDDGFPTGVEAILELPLPDLSFGTTSIANMQFGTSLALRARPEFELAIRAHLSEEDAPFAIIIFILGGAGFVDVRARYLPFSGNLSSDVTVGISVGAMIGFNFGPFKGSVYMFLGVAATLHTDHTEGEQTLAYHIILVIGGEVDVFGFISVGIKAQLKLTYDQGSFSGKGSVSIRVKVCWLVTVTASASVEYEFGESSNPTLFRTAHTLTAAAASEFDTAAAVHLHMLV